MVNDDDREMAFDFVSSDQASPLQDLFISLDSQILIV